MMLVMSMSEKNYGRSIAPMPYFKPWTVAMMLRRMAKIVHVCAYLHCNFTWVDTSMGKGIKFNEEEIFHFL